MITKKPVLKSEVKQQTLILFGNQKDPEIADRINRAFIQGRKVELQARPSFDTGLGKCGKHLCHCKQICQHEYAKDQVL